MRIFSHSGENQKYNFKPLSKLTPVKKQIWPIDITPLVTISCITYNQEKYIQDAIDGFLIQKTTFPVEIIIHDDASTDRTTEIIRKFNEKYPNVFNIIIQDENQHSKKDGSIYARFVFPKVRGKYIALCEGDDYWTDPLKLQKQVDFLEKNKEYSLVISRQRNIDDQGNIIGEGKGGTRTMMFLSSIKIPQKFSHMIPYGDTYLKATLKLHGKCYCFDEVMAVWRKHDGGVWGSLQAKEDQHKLEYNRGLTKLGIGLTFIDEGHVKSGINYLIRSYFHFFKASNVKLKLTEKIYFFLKVIKNFLFKY